MKNRGAMVKVKRIREEREKEKKALSKPALSHRFTDDKCVSEHRR